MKNVKAPFLWAGLGMLLGLLYMLSITPYSSSYSSTNPPLLDSLLESPDGEEISIPAMAFVEGGSFTMGCKGSRRDGPCDIDEIPRREMEVGPFWISRTEVTNAQFAAFLNARGNEEEGGRTWIIIDDMSGIREIDGRFRAWEGREQYPVNKVSWYGARAYTAWLAEVTGRQYRLPSEAEWEYAARGGTRSRSYRYSGSRKPDDVAWYDRNSMGFPRAVGQMRANELGLHDMSGNVWEWCQDCYFEELESLPRNGRPSVEPPGPPLCEKRVLRGGGYEDYENGIRAGNRILAGANRRVRTVGFRVARGI